MRSQRVILDTASDPTATKPERPGLIGPDQILRMRMPPDAIGDAIDAMWEA